MALLIGPKDYENEPPRHPALRINAKEPFNAEPPPSALVASYITPIDMFYKRNHGPIPILKDPSSYRLEITGLAPKKLSLSLEAIRSLKKHTVVATLQCAGNRRTAMSDTRKVKGVGWGISALGNGIWGGVLLSDVLELAGIPCYTRRSANGGKHVEFISVDQCKEEKGGPYRASVPLLQATDPEAEVLLAYEMNGEELTRDHGYPLRIVVPGVIGARSVKWLASIDICPIECQGFFQQQDYKMFPPWVDWNNIVWPSRRPLMDFPVQCAICTPSDGSFIKTGTTVKISGYALSGGGRGIERVEVSLDGGRTWIEATRLQSGRSAPSNSYISDVDEQREKWAWVLWEYSTTMTPPTTIIAKAVDSSANVQPQKVEDIWNLRGVLNNSWHEVHVKAEPQSIQSSL
ncbi:sulfite oxidase [Marchantia polymorpha subsp. ruderalis]|uniref:Sulfite oxidase n=2 Tax=Marchantia polymorpha TaxID=3197 RepID=A0AAF6B1D1_MARPO|nr:hypothetical protein MARPO_0004s0050 [Marchantia polymorpha]BBN05815.1 hypothetical protein Mp_3g16210 [Marchantia polymorpha subsp. ruderalis]|eukprot:PTQ48762.1 hypothetical protein MARPO_0004s0050 [Marchantia polymorpha]